MNGNGKRILTLMLAVLLALGGMAASVPLRAQAVGESVTVIDLSTLDSVYSGPGWVYIGDRLYLYATPSQNTFHIRGDGSLKKISIRPQGMSTPTSGTYPPFNGTIILENTNTEIYLGAALDFIDGSTALIRLLGENRLQSNTHAGININSGNLTIQPYDASHASLTAIGANEANAIGAGEGYSDSGKYFQNRPIITITGNCTVSAQVEKPYIYAMGTRLLTMDNGASLNLINPSDTSKGVNSAAVKNLFNCTVGGNAAGDLTGTYYERFYLTPGATYYFDLRSQNIPGVQSTALASGLGWVPFVYAGSVNAYMWNADGQKVDPETPATLFVAAQTISCDVSWDELDTTGLIAGVSANFGHIPYTLRAPSGGSFAETSLNEWDQMLNKHGVLLAAQNSFWCQDTDIHGNPAHATVRGGVQDRTMLPKDTAAAFRPVLAVSDNALAYDALRTATFSMGTSGKLGGADSALTQASVVYTGTLTLPPVTPEAGFTFTAPVQSGRTLGWYCNGLFYEAGATPDLPSGAVLTVGYAPEKPVVPFIDGSVNTPDGPSALDIALLPLARLDQPSIACITAQARGTYMQPSLNVTDAMVTASLEKARAAATAQNRTAYGTGIQIALNTPVTAAITVTLERAALDRLVHEKAVLFTVKATPAALTLDAQALATLKTQSDDDVTLTIRPVTVAGARSAFAISADVIKDGAPLRIAGLETGSMTLSLPYRPTADEHTGRLYAAHISTDGLSARIADSIYDADTKKLISQSPLFSVYVIDYEMNVPPYSDIDGHWAQMAIEYATVRGLFDDSAEGRFYPDAAITRGDFVTALGRIADIDTAAYTQNSFTDVKADSACQPYITWANEHGVIQGIGNGLFAPDRAITRQEIAVIFKNFAHATGTALPLIREAKPFTDESAIGEAYADAAKAVQQAGIITGTQDNGFDPGGHTTRAQACTMLYRYIRLTIDPMAT